MLVPPHVLAAIRQPAFVYRPEGFVEAANDLAEALAGGPLAGTTPAEIVARLSIRRRDGTPLLPDDLPAARALRGGEAVDVPLTVTAADGRTVRVLATASAVRDGDTVAGALAVWQDVTERVQDEIALRENDERFRAFQENSLDRFTILRPCYDDRGEIVDFTYVYQNARAARTAGRSPEELVGRRMTEIWPTFPRTRFFALYKQVAETGQAAEFEERHEADGVDDWFRATVTPIPGGIATATEIVTGRRRAEEALRESEERFRAFVKASSDVIYRMNPDWTEMRQLRGKEFIPDTCTPSRTWLDTYIHPDDQPHVLAVIRAAIRAKGIFDLEHRVLRVDGTLGWTHSRAIPLLDEAGEIVEWFGTASDITERVRAEEALKESEALYRRLFGNTEDGFALVEPIVDETGSSDDYRILKVNEAWERQTGLRAADTVGRRIREILPGVEPAWSATFAEVARSGTSQRFESSSADSGQWFDLHAFPYREGQVGVLFREITGRKEAEAALRESAERFRTSFETTPLGVALGDLEGTVLESNTALEEMLGYSKDALRGMSFAAFTHPEDATLEWPLIEQVLAGETGRYEIEKRYIRSDGEIIWVRLIGTVLRDGAGAPRSGLAIIEDITERREAERRLQYHADLVETVTDAIISTDTDLVIKSWNRAAERMYGWAADEVVGVKGSDLLGTEFPEEVDREALTADLFGRGFWHGELIQRTKDGRSICVEATSIRLTDEAGATTGAVSVSRDITGRKRTEAALLEASEKYRELFVHDITGNFIAAADGRILDCNPAFARIFGFASVEEALGTSIIDTYASLADRDDMLERIRSEGQVESDERFRQRRDGTPIHVVENVQGIFDGDGNLVRTQGYIIDDTKRYVAEEALREYAENLRRSNEDLERFAYVSSHDLQEPLRAIVSFSQLLERRYKGKLGQDADEYIAFIVEGGNRMQALILDLLAYSRVNTKAQELRPTDVEAVVAAVERNLAFQLTGAGATLTYDPLPRVTADPLQLEQVFSNLVSNAVKFRRPDVPLRIHVSARRTDGSWEFAVQDNGIGIDPEYYDRIFVIFQRLHTKEAYPGTGIGLAIVKRIVDRHGGTIRVESTPGEGSTFFVTLPAA